MNIGDHIEFLSDAITDKGPCTGTIKWNSGGPGGKYGIQLSDEQIVVSMKDLLTHLDRKTKHARTNKPLWIIK